MRKLRPTPAGVIACVALAIALGGTALAATTLVPRNSVGSAQVINGSLRKADLSRATVAALHGARGVRGPQGIQGAQGPPGAQGAQGAQGVQGVPGTARAYGLVSADGTLTRSKNVVSVTAEGSGVYCIALAAGIDAGQTGAVVTPDYAEDLTDLSGSTNGNQAIAEFASASEGCAAGQLEVDTGVRTVTTTGSADNDVREVDNVPQNEGFFFIVP
jgi:Collagen triple helix repeat (20 copies)